MELSGARQSAVKKPCCHSLSQAVEMRANDGVALAGCSFQPFAIADCHAAMRVVDKSCLLERGGDDTDGRNRTVSYMTVRHRCCSKSSCWRVLHGFGAYAASERYTTR